MERLALAALCGYVLGSIPTAYLVVRWKSQLDIRSSGSGNVGTVNSYEVTKSVFVAATVLIFDFAKGAAAVMLVRLLFEQGSDPGPWGGLGAVLGHNYPVWLRGKGGRGLATGAGASSLVFWGLIPTWVTFWALSYAVIRRVNPASAVACMLTIVTVLAFPALLPGADRMTGMTPAWFAGVLVTLILLRLIDPVRSYVLELKRQRSAQ